VEKTMTDLTETTEMLAKAEEILKPFARVVNRPSPDRIDFTILPTRLESAIRTFVAEKWGYLTAITGIDRPGTAATLPEPKQWARTAGEQEESSAPIEQEGSIEVLYHFCHKAAIVTLRTSVRYSFPVIPSVCDILPAATLYERELIEMFGVKIFGTPIKEHLLLPDDWPDGTFPLRKSFKALQNNPTGEA
jgi:NADH:ubiquinone oxidoreductase subunit C